MIRVVIESDNKVDISIEEKIPMFVTDKDIIDTVKRALAAININVKIEKL